MALNFWQFINERHHIYLRRFSEKKPWPWTEDPILQRHHFCNVFRDLDRTSAWWAETGWRQDSLGMTLVNTALFRFFNKPSTWELIGGWQYEWGVKYRRQVSKTLQSALDNGVKLYSGAYMVTGTMAQGRAKHDAILDSITDVWKRRERIAEAIREERGSMEVVVNWLRVYPMFGGFTAYEVACDLHMTKNIEGIDRMTWAHAGPGAIRGLNRIHGRLLSYKRGETVHLSEMRDLLIESRRHWEHRRPLDMRAIEHSLCEFDKYCRVDEGGTTRRYNHK